MCSLSVCYRCKNPFGFPVYFKIELWKHCTCGIFPICLECALDLIIKFELSEKKSFNCPLCQIPFVIDQCFDNNGRMVLEKVIIKEYKMALMMDQLFGRIDCHQCRKWRGTRIDYEMEHIHSCPHPLIKCYNMDCQYFGLDIAKHKQVCPHRPTKCEYCHFPCKAMDLQSHVIWQCNMYMRKLLEDESNRFYDLQSKVLQVKNIALALSHNSFQDVSLILDFYKDINSFRQHIFVNKNNNMLINKVLVELQLRISKCEYFLGNLHYDQKYIF